MLRPFSWKKMLLLVPALLLLVYFVGAQQTEAPAKAPDEKAAPDTAHKSNPVKPTPESLAKGKKMYAMDCAMCHGENGDGKGDMATEMKNITDFTNPDSLKGRLDSDLFTSIRKGKGEMPPEGDRAKDEDIWHLLNYVKSFAKK